MPKIIAIVGPTSSGKSALGVFLAQKLRGEIISADSRQVYKDLNIGTGKLTKKEMAGVPHHLLDIASFKKQFNASDFVDFAHKAIEKISTKKKVPVVVGGTGFYTDTLLGRMQIANVPPNPKLRAQLEKKTVKQLFSQLKKLNPKRAETIEPHHKRRLIRAIEIAEGVQDIPAHLGSSQRSRPHPASPLEVLWLGLNPDEKRLKKNIHTRLLARMKAGMVDEAKKLHRAGLSYKRMNELGLEYRYLALYLQNKLTYEQMLGQLEQAIGRYAKRQKRWFKRNPKIIWVKNKNQALKLAQKFIGGR